MNKLSVQEWNKLTREEQKEALLSFREPDNLPVPTKYLDINKTDYNRFK